MRRNFIPTQAATYAIALSSAFDQARDPKTGLFTSPRPSATDSKSSSDNKMKNIIPFAILILVIGGVLFWAVSAVKPSPKAADERVAIKDARAKQTLNKDYTFPIKDEKGAKVTELKYFLESAELRDEILVKGQRAVAVKGRTFLVLNIKLTNNFSKSIDVNARDYIRVSVNGNSKELYAADIHNDPVNVQAGSTKITRLGFPINDSDKKITLSIGELNGEKKSLELNLK